MKLKGKREDEALEKIKKHNLKEYELEQYVSIPATDMVSHLIEDGIAVYDEDSDVFYFMNDLEKFIEDKRRKDAHQANLKELEALRRR